ncbi:MAG: hypothetical protein LBF15_01130 [Candidatus Peribacteria bacterium]|nr:hypothetical protein [Candidatus Peribacteria bacterium]
MQDSKATELEEIRRLFFVAITRARENLYLSYPAGEDRKVYLESQFI